MKRSKVILLLLVLAAFSGGLFIDAAHAGGWAVATLEELPSHVVAGRPLDIRFAVRQHGHSLMPGLSPLVTAVHSGTRNEVTVEATETRSTGIYQASIALPEPGEWTWSIDAFSFEFVMPPLTVMAGTTVVSTAPEPAPSWPIAVGGAALVAAVAMVALQTRQRRRIWLMGCVTALVLALAAFAWQLQQPKVIVAEAEPETITAAIRPEQIGEALFVAKGCIFCHQNDNATMATNPFEVGPRLTDYRASAEFLRMWLADPAGVRPRTTMPNLELSDAEIELLIPFINQESER